VNARWHWRLLEKTYRTLKKKLHLEFLDKYDVPDAGKIRLCEEVAARVKPALGFHLPQGFDHSLRIRPPPGGPGLTVASYLLNRSG
jgi:hypothetical protein